MKNYFRLFVASIFAILSNDRGVLDLTSFAAGLKTLYTDKKINRMTYQDNAFFALVPKDEKFYGDSKKCPIIYGNPQARSATMSTAVTNFPSASTQISAFVLTRVQDFSLAQINNQVIKASESDMGAFLRAAKVEIDSAMNAIVRSLSIALYRNGGGAIGQVGNASFSTTVLTLVNANDVVNFEVGQTLQASSDDGTGGAGVRTGTLSVVKVDRIGGTVTMSGNLSSGIAAIAQNDYLFMAGDYNLKLSGLAAWLPYGGPSATTFFGVNRTVDSTRLGGIWQDGSAKPIEEALSDLAVLIAREGGRPDHCFMSYADWANLEKALGTKVQYANVSPDEIPEISFRGVIVNGPRGPIKCIPDQNCPSGLAYMLQLDTWELSSLGKAPQLFNTDGLDMLRDSTTDALNIRIYYYAQLGCMAPGFNGVVKLSSVVGTV